ncbi:hypothetical protein [Herpetosiphon llansteffanensis]|uniref:hypothetical protein n=1 Tax=Herpetosiphon llansteffanensis TaxID=2094568 RepID=UPI000D7C1F4F|nr:hypothetical protein [Herpetosiphon llansteffanensis]
MWFQRVLLWLAVLGFAILVLAIGSAFLAVGSMFLAVCATALLLTLYFWPIIGAVISWKSMGLFQRPEKKPHYWGLGLLCLIYGVGISLLAIDDLWFLGDWILLGNGIGLILRSVLVEWRVAEVRARRLIINLLLALVLPISAKTLIEYPRIKDQDCKVQAALDQTAEKLFQYYAQHGNYPPSLELEIELNSLAFRQQCKQTYGWRYIDVDDYASKEWVYQPQETSYRLGYYRTDSILFLYSRYIDRVCWYDPATQASSCHFVLN